MKQWILSTAVLFSLASCNGEREKENTSKSEQETPPAVVHTEEPKKAKATKIDTVFDDFLLAYATDSQTQWSRTRFPLPYTVNGLKKEITCSHWKMDPLYSVEDFYTLLFNTEEDLDLPTNTHLNESTFEWIIPEKETVKQYHFGRNGYHAWILDSITELPVTQSHNADFLTFYRHFATNPDYRKKHVKRKVQFITNFTDDNDGFGTDQFLVDADQWLAWDVPMPSHYLSNIIYGPVVKDKNPNLKILCIKAMDGAFFKALYFRKHPKNGWQLFKYEDTAY